MDSVIHVKATFEGDVRRFQCQPSFEILESSLRTLFACKPEDQIVITYLDDENEYCRISSQMELDYAVTLPSPLRLVMKLASSKPEPQPMTTAEPANEAAKARLAAINTALENANLPPHKREKLLRRKEMILAKVEGKAQSQQQPACPNRRVLEERLAMINSALEQPNLPPHRFENLERRKDAISHKLNHCEALDSEVTPHAYPSCAPHGHPPYPSFHNPTDAHSRCTERLQTRLAIINSKLAQPDLPPHKVEKLSQKKAFLEAKLADPSVRSGDRVAFQQSRLAMINTALEQPDLSPEKREKLTQKKERISAKLANPGDKTQFFQMRLNHINAALDRPDLPAQRRENLTLKKKMIEDKLAGKCSVESPQGSPKPWHQHHHFGSQGPHQPHSFPHGPHHGPHPHGPHQPHPHGPHHGHGPHPHGPHFGHPGHTVPYPPPQGPHPGFPHPPAFGHGPVPYPPPPSPYPGGSSPLSPPPFGFPHDHPHCPPPPHGFGAHPGMMPHHGHEHGHPRGGHPGGWGCRGGNLEEKLAWINQTLEQPGLPPHKVTALNQRKAMIEAKIASKGTANDTKGELVALRSAVGVAKVNLKNARQSGLKDEQLAPFIDAVTVAKANLIKRRLELKSAGACPATL